MESERRAQVAREGGDRGCTSQRRWVDGISAGDVREGKGRREAPAIRRRRPRWGGSRWRASGPTPPRPILRRPRSAAARKAPGPVRQASGRNAGRDRAYAPAWSASRCERKWGRGRTATPAFQTTAYARCNRRRRAARAGTRPTPRPAPHPSTMFVSLAPSLRPATTWIAVKGQCLICIAGRGEMQEKIASFAIEELVAPRTIPTGGSYQPTGW